VPTEMDEAILQAINTRGVRRLTHFTNTKNLPHILRAGELSSTARLEASSVPFARTDPERLDGRPDFICCNVEFPNMWYFDYATGRENVANYSDWCVFLIDPRVAATPGTLYSPLNAARGRGGLLTEGLEGFERMYRAQGFDRFDRAPRHWLASPTDGQAEVLIRDRIPLSDVLGIVVRDEEALNREVGRLEMIGVPFDGLEWYTSDELFRQYRIRSAVRNGLDVTLTGPWDQTSRSSGG